MKGQNQDQFLRTDGGNTKSNAIEIPSISLPKGGGAIKGIDEKFVVNSINGTASFSILLPFSPTRGAATALSLSYNSGSGNGIFGLGWNLGLSSIKRKTDKGLPQYMDAVDSDIFLFSEVEDLVPEFKKDAEGHFILDVDEYIINETESADQLYTIRYYRPRIEGLFARIERWSNKTSEEKKWRVTTKDNVTTLFGWTDQSRISDPKDKTKIFEWLPEFIFDDKGNCSHYQYKKEDATGLDPALLHNRNRIQNNQITYTNLYLDKILYGNQNPYKKFGDPFPSETNYLFQTVFDYGILQTNDSFETINNWDFRADAFSDYKAGFEIRTTRLCRRVLLFHVFPELDKSDKRTLIRSVNFEYDTSTEQDFTFLKAVTSYGYIKKTNAYTHKKFPPTEFEYQKHDWNKEIKTIASDALVHSPSGLDEHQYLFTDLYNEGLSGILTEQANGWYYKHNLGKGKFEQARLVSPKPSFSGLGGQLQLADLDADGGKQIVSYDAEGYFELNDNNEWEPLRYFKTIPNINFNDSNTRILDLNGDGLAEIVISEENGFTWYASEGRAGFAAARKTTKPFDEEEGPHIVFADAKQTIFLADMSGDGMTDIVRIRNGEICYWPNLGYGKFGAKIALDNAPLFDHPDYFNPSYIRLADIDGSGTTDIIYIGKNKFTCWKNLSGNRLSDIPFEIESFPEIHDLAKVTVTDLLGNGLACIVWSSPLAKDAAAPLKYIDLMNSKKPHIMATYKNNLGKEVSLEYTPSTQFYIEDKLAGKPWVTKLHFPVHCISKTIVEDKITGHKFISSYKYHHGYYDHTEREFRGFGMVEQTDTETFEHWAKQDATNITQASLHQEPVITKSWCHTGAFLSQDNILNQFEQNYWYREYKRLFEEEPHHPEIPMPDVQMILSEGLNVSLIGQLSATEWQQAIRACKGMTLRSEVFASDAIKYGNTEAAKKRACTPFSVATHNCFIELLQPKGKNKHAVFMVKESEAITYNYERNPQDPRIAHTLNIRSDRYGNILESASVVYPRKIADATLPLKIQQEQTETPHILYTLNQFTNDVLDENAYRLRLPSETKTYQLKNVSKKTTGAAYYAISDFENILDDIKSNPVAYHEMNEIYASGKARKRLIEHVRSTYYRNSLGTALGLHELESLALPFESYQLAYTPGLLADIFGPKVNDALLIEGKFTHSEHDVNWWVRSGTVQYISTAAGEMAIDAENRFYIPVAYTDPYGAVTKIKMDAAYKLFIESVEDAFGNTTKVDRFCFRTLAPRRMKDINCNVSEAITDELGLVKAIAIMGKEGIEADELTEIEEATNTAEADMVNDFFHALASDQLIILGKRLLNRATTRFVYDLNTYMLSGKPAVVAAISREQHYRQLVDAPVQITFEYSGGSGEVVMKKVQAKPGMAKQVSVKPDNTMLVHDLDTGVQLRWIGNGKTVKNNKGNVVKQYEPYFSVTWQYESYKELVETGVTPLMYYDAAGRLIKTEMPDGSFSKVEFDSWKQTVYDANDTALESDWYKKRTENTRPDFIADLKEQQAAAKTAFHTNTPNVLHFDTLGRPVLTNEHYKNSITGASELYTTQVQLDIEGNVRTVTDARGNTVMQYKYDMLGNKVYQNSTDAGQRWLLTNILGKPLRTWDGRNHEFQYFYDLAQRPTNSMVLGGDSTILYHVFDRIIYGESLLAADRSNEADLQARNILGQIIQHYDTGGLIDTPNYDFKGQPLAITRRLFKKYKETANWTDANLGADLEPETFTFRTETDALGRMSKQTAPDGSMIIPSYNEAGLLNGESVLHSGSAVALTYIKDIHYNEKGQREKIIYGNDVSTKFEYDKETFRLKRLESKRKNGDILQCLLYTYDPVGNITTIEDLSQPITFFSNSQVEPKSEYTYDTLYRLIQATGKENDKALAWGTCDNWNDTAFIQKNYNWADPLAVRRYTQKFQYDAVGNILQMKHEAAGGNWTRNYEYEISNNRLKTTYIGNSSTPASYTRYHHHTQHGFMEELPHLEKIVWNFKEEVVLTTRQRCTNDNIPATTYYQYDGSGQRIRKITENQATAGAAVSLKEERIYLSGYELYKKHLGADAGLERSSLSLIDQGSRFVMIETRNDIDDGTEKQLTRYQLYNHLGSAALELDDKAKVISYEEYHPYGTTAFQLQNSTIKAVAKRYRYTGMERDEETGLSYHSARYYLPWLGRWLSADPIGIGDGVNVYGYCNENPLINTDATGRQTEGSTQIYGSSKSFGFIKEHWMEHETLKLMTKSEGFNLSESLERYMYRRTTTSLLEKRFSQAIKTPSDAAIRRGLNAGRTLPKEAFIQNYSANQQLLAAANKSSKIIETAGTLQMKQLWGRVGGIIKAQENIRLGLSERSGVNDAIRAGEDLYVNSLKKTSMPPSPPSVFVDPSLQTTTNLQSAKQTNFRSRLNLKGGVSILAHPLLQYLIIKKVRDYLVGEPEKFDPFAYYQTTDPSQMGYVTTDKLNDLKQSRALTEKAAKYLGIGIDREWTAPERERVNMQAEYYKEKGSFKSMF